MSTKFCDSCGAVMNEGETVCSACGHVATAVNTEDTQPQYQQPAEQYQQPAPQYQQPTPQYQQPAPQYQQPAPQYQQPQYPQSGYVNPQPGYINPQLVSLQPDTRPMSMGDYILMIFLSVIPIAGLILQLVWAFDSNINVNKKNYARALLIIDLVAVGLFIILCIIIAACGGSAHSSYSNYYNQY